MPRLPNLLRNSTINFRMFSHSATGSQALKLLDLTDYNMITDCNGNNTNITLISMVSLQNFLMESTIHFLHVNLILYNINLIRSFIKKPKKIVL